jgi:hypothetical protein
MYYGILKFSCDSYRQHYLNTDKILSKCECNDHVTGTWSFLASNEAL